MALDLDRGVTQKRHPDGMLVGLYKDTLEFVGEKGESISIKLAKEAGFDTEFILGQRTTRALRAKGEQEIDRIIKDGRGNLRAAIQERLEKQGLAKESDELEALVDAEMEAHLVQMESSLQEKLNEGGLSPELQQELTEAEALAREKKKAEAAAKRKAAAEKKATQ